MPEVIDHLVSGKQWRGTSTRFSDVSDPNRGTVRSQVRLASAADVDEVVRVAVQAQREWASWNP